MAGSTSVEPFAELLAEEYMIRHPQSRIYVQGGGSTAGIEAVRTRAAQIGMSSRSLITEEKNLYAVTIAKDAIAIIVHPKNPVQDLSLDPDKTDILRKDKKLEGGGGLFPSNHSGHSGGGFRDKRGLSEDGDGKRGDQP